MPNPILKNAKKLSPARSRRQSRLLAAGWRCERTLRTPTFRFSWSSRNNYLYHVEPCCHSAQDIDRLAHFYAILGIHFNKHQHGKGPEHLSSTIGETVFEIYPAKNSDESTVSTRLGFSVPSLANVLEQLRNIHATVVAEPSETPFGRRAVVKDFEGHKVELYEKAI